MCVVIDDGSEDIEARIDRRGAEIGRSARDLFEIRKYFSGPIRAAWDGDPATLTSNPTQRPPEARRKDLPCTPVSVIG
jgi:hypothetical protein